MARQVEWRLTHPQSEAWQILSQGKPSTLCLEWGRGTGKSHFQRHAGIWMQVATHWKRRAVNELGKEFSGVRVAGLMPTLKQFRDVHAELLEQECYGDWKFLGGELNASTLEISFPNGSWFKPVPAAMATSKTGRGIRCDVILGDECDDIDPSVRAAVAKPWLSEKFPPGQSIKHEIYGGTYRRGRYGLLYQLRKFGLDPELPRYHTIHATYRDCPEIVDSEEVEDARRTTPKAIFAREWECDPDSAEGLVYPFEEDFHVREIAPEAYARSRIVVGADHGWMDPGVLLEFAIIGHGQDAILWATREFYASERPNSEWDSIVRQHYQGVRIWADPSRPDRIADYRRAGAHCQGADNAIEAGVARLTQLMSKREDENGAEFCQFYVSRNCPNLIRELGCYRRKRDPHTPDAFLEQIEDKNNHACDAGRYVAISEFGPYSGSGRHLADDA